MTTTETTAALTPYQVAEETFVIPWHLPAPPIGFFPMHSLVIRGAEPVIVDTGAPAARQEWLEAVWSIVDPKDVRWVFLSHDDRDHAGNLLQVLEACPKATLLTSWFAVGRMFEEWATPLDRCRFLNSGERIDVGDRQLLAIRPPVFDNPTTRGLFDNRTGVFWSVDTFATPLPQPMQFCDELGGADFTDGQLLGSRLVAAWHTLLDENKFGAYVDEVQRLGMTTVAGCHTPAITGSRLDEAFGMLRRLPGLDPWAEFTQADLEMWMSQAEAQIPDQAGAPS